MLCKKKERKEGRKKGRKEESVALREPVAIKSLVF
jgi:hypothetical protein